jgi:acyl-coenzyme A thioesterase PaaI-like protein
MNLSEHVRALRLDRVRVIARTNDYGKEGVVTLVRLTNYRECLP